MGAPVIIEAFLGEDLVNQEVVYTAVGTAVSAAIECCWWCCYQPGTMS